MGFKTKGLSLALAMVLLVSSFGASFKPAKAGTKDIIRIGGEDRYATAVAISKKADLKTGSLIVASGENFADALVFSVLAMKEDMPLLLARKDELGQEVRDEILRLGPKTIILAGGESTLSAGVEEDLARLGDVRRIGGTNRYETSLQLKAYMEEKYGSLETLAVADGRNFPDALVASPYIYPRGGVVLTNEDYPYPQANLVLGGPRSVEGYEGVERISGENRYETAIKIAARMEYENLIICNGTTYPDALAASVLAKVYNSAILLTDKDSMPQGLENLLKSKDLSKVFLIGGVKSISPSIEEKIKALNGNQTQPSDKVEDQEEGQIASPNRPSKPSRPGNTQDPSKPEDTTYLKEFEELLDQANSLVTQDYSPETFAKFERVLEEAKNVSEEDKKDQEKIIDLTRRLKEALEGLETKKPVDKSGLEEAIKKAQAYKEEDYTQESYIDLVKALEEALTTYKDDKATSEDITRIKDIIDQAINKLVTKASHMTKILEDLLAQAKAIDPSLYRKEGLDELAIRINQAQERLDEDKPSYQDLLKAKTDLEEAINNLKPIPRPEELFTYEISKNQVILRGLTERGREEFNTSKTLVLPGIIEGKPVSKVGEKAFENLGLEKIILGENIIDIGLKAFNYNPLKEVVFNDKLENIGDFSFSTNEDMARLEEIKLGPGVKTIGAYAFQNSLIEEVDLPSSLEKLEVTSFINSKGHHLTAKVHLYTPDLKNPNKLVDGYGHIVNPGLVKLTYLGPDDEKIQEEIIFKEGENYYHIGDQVSIRLESPDPSYDLEDPQLSLKLEDKLTEIEIKLVEKETELNLFAYEEVAGGIKLTGLTQEGKDHISEGKSLEIPSEYKGQPVLELDEYAFQNEKIKELRVTKSIKEIAFKAFFRNPITKLILEDGIEKVGVYAFGQYNIESKLEKLTLPPSIKEIGDNAFNETNIKEVDVPNSLISLSPSAFSDSLGNDISKKVHIFTEDFKNINNLRDSKHHTIDPAKITIIYTYPDGGVAKEISRFSDQENTYHIGDELTISLESPDPSYTLEKDLLNLRPTGKNTRVEVKLIEKSEVRYVSEIEELEPISVPLSTSELDLKQILPKSVKFKDSHGDLYDAPIEFSIQNYQGDRLGSYWAYGRLDLPEGVRENPDIDLNIKVEIRVIEEVYELKVNILNDDEVEISDLEAFNEDGKVFKLKLEDRSYYGKVPKGLYDIRIKNLDKEYVIIDGQNILVENKNIEANISILKGINLKINSVDTQGNPVKGAEYRTKVQVLNYNTWNTDIYEYGLVIPDPNKISLESISLDLVEVPVGYKLKTDLPLDISKTYGQEINIVFERDSQLVGIEVQDSQILIKPSSSVAKANFTIRDTDQTLVYIGSFENKNPRSLKIDLSGNKHGPYSIRFNISGKIIEENFDL